MEFARSAAVADLRSPAETAERDALAALRSRIIKDYDKLAQLSAGLHVTGQKIGATIGTFDLLHPGHARYIMSAKALCDILIVGIDSDRAVKGYKDETRPIVPEDERLEMVLHTGYADYVTLIDDVTTDGIWRYGLLDSVKPDVFITSVGSYSAEQLRDLRTRCPEVVEMQRQAATSTSEKVRQMMMNQGRSLGSRLRSLADEIESGGGR